MQHRLTCTFASLLLTSLSIPVVAADHDKSMGAYVGISLGQASYKNSEEAGARTIGNFLETIDIFYEAQNTNADDSDSGFALVTGYKFSPHFALEFSYYDLGKIDLQIEGILDDFFFDESSVTAEVKGPALQAIGSIPLRNNWELYGKAGLLFADVDHNLELGSFIIGDVGGSSSSASPTLGLGAAYHISDRWSVRLDLQRFFDVGKESQFGEVDINLFSLGFTVGI
jgi:opacity protein-like surface antigen